MRVLFVFGTRPEAIKLCPVIQCLRRYASAFDVKVCVTAQHRQMLDQVLETFRVKPEYDLDAMLPAQTLARSTSRMLAALEPVLKDAAPDLTIVQGDTTTTLCGALAAFYAGAPVAHVEAGLRTGDMRQPFPEEMNRLLVSRLASLHFAPTSHAAEALRREGIAPSSIVVTGNTGIDAVLHVKSELERGAILGRPWPQTSPKQKLIVVTAHRRESFGAGFERICTALALLAKRNDVQLVFPVHPNPSISGVVRTHLENLANIHLVEPLDYVSFVDLMRHAYLVLTDSGGVQEEGPSLGKPILVMRNKTERPEGIQAGTVELVGNTVEKIVETCSWLLEDQTEYLRRTRIHNPYGDGRASERIVSVIRNFRSDRPATTGEACRVAPARS